MARKLCTKEGCEDQSISRGLCPKHYQALRRREKDPLVGTRQRGRTPLDVQCAVDGCVETSYARGLCGTHYRKALRRIKRRTFAEQVLALWDQYDLGADLLGWEVDPETEEIHFMVWTVEGQMVAVHLTRDRLGELAESLKGGAEPESVFESWAKSAA